MWTVFKCNKRNSAPPVYWISIYMSPRSLEDNENEMQLFAWQQPNNTLPPSPPAKALIGLPVRVL